MGIREKNKMKQGGLEEALECSSAGGLGFRPGGFLLKGPRRVEGGFLLKGPRRVEGVQGWPHL